MKFKGLPVLSVVSCVALLSVAAVLTGVVSRPSAALASQSNQDPVLTAIINGIKSRESKVTSIAAYLVDEVYKNHDAELLAYLQQKDSGALELQKWPSTSALYFWASDGDRVRKDERAIKTYYKQIFRTPSAPDKFKWMTVAPDRIESFDGERTQQFNAGNGSDESPYCFNSVDPKYYPTGWASLLQLPLGRDSRPTSNEIASQSSQIVGTEYVGGVQTYKVETRSNTYPQLTTLWIAPELGYLAVKQNMCGTGPIQAGRKVRVVDQVEKVDEGLWIPKVSRFIDYRTLGGSREVWTSMKRLCVSSSKINETLPSALFEIPLAPGTSYWTSRQPPVKATGDPTEFASQLAEAKQRGEQPDLDSVDVKSVLSRVQSEQPPAVETVDVPLHSLATG